MQPLGLVLLLVGLLDVAVCWLFVAKRVPEDRRFLVTAVITASAAVISAAGIAVLFGWIPV